MHNNSRKFQVAIFFIPSIYTIHRIDVWFIVSIKVPNQVNITNVAELAKALIHIIRRHVEIQLCLFESKLEQTPTGGYFYLEI